MNFFNELMKILDTRMTKPTMYGWFHITSFIIMIVATILLCKFFNKSNQKQHNMILLIISLLLLLFEVYKQLNFSYNHNSMTWDYQWYAFPFQFCSTPMYVALIASFIKNEKIQSYFNSYLALYCLFAGLSVMLYPATVFTSVIGINIQTMLHHGCMVILGVYIISCNRCKLEIKSLLKAFCIFIALVIVALLLNVILPKFAFSLETEDFNMFFISPYLPSSLPILCDIYGIVSYPIFLVIYLFGFTFCAFVILMLSYAIKKLIENVKKLSKIEKNTPKILENQ